MMLSDSRTKSLLPVDYQPSQFSVICGNKRACFCSPGNRRFRALCQMHLNEYMNAPTKHEKSLVVSKVLGILSEACPVGTFVTFENGRWWEVSHRSSREKVGTFFRDMLADKYKSSAKNKVIQRRQKRNQTNASAKKEGKKSVSPTNTTTMTASMPTMKSAMMASKMRPEGSSSSSSSAGGIDMSKFRRLSAPASLTANLSTERDMQMQLSQFGAPIMPSMRQVLASQFLPISSLTGQAAETGDNFVATTQNTPMDHQYPQSAPASPVSSSTQFAPILASAASTPDIRSSFTAVLPFASSAEAVADSTTAALASLIPAAQAQPSTDSDNSPVLETLEDHLLTKVMAELAMTDVDDPSLNVASNNNNNNDNTETNEGDDLFDGSSSIGSGGFYDVDDLEPASL